MDLFDLLGDPDDASAQEKAQAYAQALRRKQGLATLAGVSGNKMLAPMAGPMAQSAEQGQEALGQVRQFRLRQAVEKQRADMAARQRQEDVAYRGQRDQVEDGFRRQQLARQPRGPEPKYQPGEDGGLYQITPEGAKPVPGPDGQPFRVPKSGANVAGVTRLRGEFQKQPTVKATSDMADAIAKIRSAPDDGAGDLSMIYSYVKILDPGSVVREGEIKLAREPTPLLAKLTTAYQRAARGQLLDPGVRAQYKQAAEALWQAQHERYEEVAGPYRQLAEQYGISPGDVVLDFYGKTNAGGPGGAAAGGSAPVRKFTRGPDGKLVEVK